MNCKAFKEKKNKDINSCSSTVHTSTFISISFTLTDEL